MNSSGVSCRASRDDRLQIGLDRRPQLLECVVQPRASRAGGRPHPFGGLGRAQAQVVDQDDDRPMLDAESPEGAVELVLDGDARSRVRDALPVAGSSRRLPR